MTAPKREGFLHACGALALAACVCLLASQRIAPPFSKQQALQANSFRRTVSTAVAWPRGTVDVNRAAAEALCALPGIGPSLAKAIVTARETGGVFNYPEDLLTVQGIGQKTLQKFYDQLDFSAQAENPHP